MKPEQQFLVDIRQPWEVEWVGMPEYVNEDMTPYRSITIHFATEFDVENFAKFIGQTITKKTKSLWFPNAEIGVISDKKYA